MIKVENIKVFNFEGAFRGLRNPLESWDRSDSIFSKDNIEIGIKDLQLAQRMINGGTDESKFMRQIFISMDITAPDFWFREFSTYKIGTVENSTSFMHKGMSRDFTLEDFSIENLKNFEKKINNNIGFDVPLEDIGEEIFVDIKQNNKYQISNYGTIIRKSYSLTDKNNVLRTYKEKVISQSVNSSNYKKVILRDENGKGTNYYVHRLIAEHFIPNPENKEQVNHIDGNKWNNNISNLEWVTPSENSKKAFDVGLREISGYNKIKVAQTSRRFSSEEVEQIKEYYSIGKTMKEIAEIYGCSDSVICNIINHKTYNIIEATPLEIFQIVVDELNALRKKWLEEKDPEIKKELWRCILELLPQSYNYRRTVTLNYQTARAMYFARRNHKLEEWREFCKILENLPYGKELICYEKEKKK